MDRKVNVYLASGWFTQETRKILDELEKYLESREDISLYSPRRDGIVLPPNQKHDTLLRESIFKENIQNILKADLVVANVYSEDSYNDPGTMYEIGYAMAYDIPVIGYSSSSKNLTERFTGILGNFQTLVIGMRGLEQSLNEYIPKLLEGESKKKKVLFVGNGDNQVDETLVAHIMDNGYSIRWLDLNQHNIASRVSEIFEDVDFMIAVVDDRKTIMSWMIGQAYARRMPIITYSNCNYGINVMLLASILTHLRGTDELDAFLQQVKRQGLESIPKFDISQLDSM